MRRTTSAAVLGLWLTLGGATWASAQATDLAAARREIEQWYEENRRAFLAKDFNAIMALRADDFHVIARDGERQERDEMAQRTEGFLMGIDTWNSISFEIDSITVSGDLVSAVVRQHLDRMVPYGTSARRMETWATQNETWRRTPQGLKLYRVDSMRDQRRLINGRPG